MLFYDLRNFSRPLHTMEAHPGAAVGAILCQPAQQQGNSSSLRPPPSTMRSSAAHARSRSKLATVPPAPQPAAKPCASQSNSNYVPTSSAENSKENLSPPPLPTADAASSPGVGFNSFGSSQVFSPLRNAEVSPAFSMRSVGSLGPVASSAHNREFIHRMELRTLGGDSIDFTNLGPKLGPIFRPLL